MSKPKRRMDMRLSFKLLRCDRCSGDRLAMQPCPECGARPQAHETQPKVEHRARIVQEFHEKRHPGVLGVAHLDTYGREIKDATNGVISALAVASRDDTTAKRILSAFRVIDGLNATWNQPLPRPNRNRGRTIGRSLSSVVHGLEYFVEALGAPTMLVAQTLQKDGQKLLDEGHRIFSELDEIDRFDELTEKLPVTQIMSALGTDAVSLVGEHGKGLSDMDARLQKLYGRSESIGAGIGLQLHMARYLATTILDAEQCHRIASEMEAILLARPSTRSLCETTSWQNEHGRVTALLSASTHMAGQSAENDATDLESVNAWMDIVIKCRDGLIRHGLATIGADTEEQYKKCIRMSAGNLIKSAADKYPLLGLNDGLSPILRNAAAHLDYDVTDAGFSTSVQGTPLYLTAEEFADQVLAYLEVAIGLVFGLNTAVASLGLEIDLPRHMAKRDRDSIVGFLLGASGLKEIEISYAASTLQIEAKGSTINWLSALASVFGIIEPRIELATARIQNPQGDMHYQTALSPYREFFEESSEEFSDRSLALAGVAAGTTVNGRSIWSEAEWINAAAAILIARPDDTTTSRVQRIKRFLQYVPAVQFPELAAQCKDLLAAVRNSTSDLSEAPIPAAFGRSLGQ